MEENALATSISYPDVTCPLKLTHQKPGHREKALYFPELIAPAHKSRATGWLIYSFIPRDALLRDGSFRKALPRSNF